MNSRDPFVRPNDREIAGVASTAQACIVTQSQKTKHYIHAADTGYTIHPLLVLYYR